MYKIVLNMDSKTPEPQDSKQVLEYYRLFGKDRDIRQYLTLPPILDLNDSNGTLCDDKNQSQLNKSEEEVVQNICTDEIPEENVKTSNPKLSEIDDKTDSERPYIEHSTKSKHKTNDSKHRDFVFNLESQIEINYDLSAPNDFEDIRQVKFEKVPSKPKGILKFDDKTVEPLSSTDQGTMTRRNTVSPTSSVASNKRLEWDSLADIGYRNPDDIDAKKPLSTLERIALQQGHKTRYGEPKEASPENVRMQSEVSRKDVKVRKFIGKPTAESTPLVLKTDESKQNLEYISNIKSMEEKLVEPLPDNNDRKILKQHKSLNDIDLKSLTTKKADKYIQTTLTRNTDKSSIHKNLNKVSDEDDSENFSKESKENVRGTPVKVTSKSKMLKKRMARRKLISIQTSLTDEDSSPGKPNENILEVLKNDNRFNISQSSLGSNIHTTSQVNENMITIADSFEYVSRMPYDDKSNKNSDYDNTSSVTKSETAQSIKSKIRKESSSSNNYMTTGTSTNLSSNKNDPLFDDVKLSTLNNDIKTGIRLLNCMMYSKKGNVELKKKMVKRIVKRLLEVNYGDDTATSDVSRPQSKLKEYTSSTTGVNSCDSKTSQAASPDPSYSLPENLVANVPWKPYKFAQGVDFIRVPTKPMANDAPVIHEQKPKSVFTIRGKNDFTCQDQSFQDLAQNHLKSEEKLNMLNDQQKMLEQNLLQQQIRTEQNHNKSQGIGLINYAKQEKDIQLAWINSEIEHLNYLKTLLENNQPEKTKFDSLGPYKVSERGDTKFDFNFFSELGKIPNRNMIYPLVTDFEVKSTSRSCPCRNMMENPSVSQKTAEPRRTSLKSDTSSKQSLIDSSYTSKTSLKSEEKQMPTSGEKGSSPSSSKESIREQLKKLTRSIEMLKQSTQLAKDNPSTRSSCITYPEWDSHINVSRPYSEVIGIDQAQKQKIVASKSSGHSTKSKPSPDISTKSKDKIDIKSNVLSENISEHKSPSHFKLVESSGTHTSLKSATISISGQNKSTESSPGWESYEKTSTRKPQVQTISTQTSNRNNSDKMVEAVMVSCNHCKKCSCKCSKKTQTLEKKHGKTSKPPVAYILTFETESTPTNSSRNGRKPSLDEVKVKLPYNRENRSRHPKTNKHKKMNNEKTVITVFDNKSRFISEGSAELQTINLGDFDNLKTDSYSEDTENTAGTLNESTLLSTSTDSFLVAREKKQNENRKHNPTVQECLVIYKSDFVKKADRRRDVINRIAELR